MSQANLKQLRQTIAAFINADTWTKSKQIVEENQLLLTDAADRCLVQLLVKSQKNERRVGLLTQHRLLLQRCREIGVDAAFAELVDIQRAIRAFISADTWDESKHIVQQHPSLLTDQADLLLQQLLQSIEDVESHQVIIDHRDLLQQCRQEGIEAAFAHISTSETRQAYQSLETYLEKHDLEALDESIAIWERILDHHDFASRPLRLQLATLSNASAVLSYRYNELGRADDLNKALALIEKAVQLAPPDIPELAMYLNNLGTYSYHLYERTGDLNELERAISVTQQAVDCASPDSDDYPDYLYNLSSHLGHRYDQTGELADLNRAIALVQQALDCPTIDARRRPDYLNTLGNHLHSLYGRTGDLADLTRAIEVKQQAVDLTPSNSPDYPRHLNNLSSALYSHYDRLGILSDLEQVITIMQEVVTLTPPVSPDYSGYLSNLALYLSERYERTGNPNDLQEAIVMVRKAAESTSPYSLDYPKILSNLASRLHDHYRLTRTSSDLEHAIHLIQQAVELISTNSPIYPGFLNTLAVHLYERYNLVGQLTDLERAITLTKQAIDSPLVEPSDRTTYLSNLSVYLSERYEYTGELNDLGQAITTAKQVVELTSPISPAYSLYLSNLATNLMARYQRERELPDLEEAIVLTQQAVELTPLESLDYSVRLNNLGQLIYERYDHVGRMTDLEQAIVVTQQALDRALESSVNFPALLNNMSNLLSEQYSHTGELAYLEQAIAFNQQSLTLTPSDSPDYPSRLSTMSNRLNERYDRQGILADLERAIKIGQQALAVLPIGSQKRPAVLNNLGSDLAALYVRTGKFTYLEQSIALTEQTVKLAPNQPSHLTNLGTKLRYRYQEMGEMADLTRAIEVGQQAADLTYPGTFERAGCLHNLGGHLTVRYMKTKNISDLKRAIAVTRQSVKATPPNSPDYPGRVGLLALELRYRYDELRHPADLKQARKNFKESCQAGQQVSLEETLGIALNWGNWAMERQAWVEAVQAYAYGIEAIDTLFQVQLQRADKETWLRVAQGVHAHAAYAAAKSGIFSQAVTFLEHGRAFLLSEALEQARVDLTHLPELGYDDLYKNYQASLNQLFVLQNQIQIDIDRLRTVRAELDATIRKIRQIEGYGDFLLPPTFEEDVVPAISTNGTQTILIYTAVTQVGGLALIVQPGGVVTPVWLDDLTEKSLREKIYGVDDAPIREGYNTAYTNRYQNFHEWHEAIDYITRWLWDILMGPLIRQILDLSKENNIASVVLIPQGLLSLLPLHAAWTEDLTKPTGRRYVIDEIPLTYAPNARALKVAHGRATIAPDAVFIVDNPDTKSPLKFASAEVAGVLSHFPEGRTKRLDQKNAVYEEVVRYLNQYPVAHFATHAQANQRRPLESGLRLANNEGITLRAVLNSQLNQIRLAILSACETAIPGRELPDEVICLPTGLIQAGVMGVIASLWAVNDASTMMMMVRFYDLWRRVGIAPAEALRRAQIWLRDTTNSEKLAYFLVALERIPETCVPPETAEQAIDEIDLTRLDQRPYATPYYWAAFSYNGI